MSTVVRTNNKDLNQLLQEVANTEGFRIQKTTNGGRILCPDGQTVGLHLSPSDTNVAAATLRKLQRHGFREARAATAATAEQRRQEVMAAERAKAEEELARAAHRAKVEERNQRMLAAAAGPLRMRVAEGGLLAEILAPHPFPQTYHVLVGPVAAAAFLERNVGPGSAGSYRRLRPHRVKMRAAQMLADEWVLTDQGFGFTVDGVLYNGAHRLHAIIETGLTLPFSVAVGMPPGTGRHVDSPMARNSGDSLHDQGFPCPSQVSAACMLVAKYDRYLYADWKRAVISLPQVLETANALRDQLADLPGPDGDDSPYAGFNHLIRRCVGKPGKGSGLVSSAAVALSLMIYRAWTGEHRATAAAFLDKVFIENVRGGLSYDEGDPRWTLREWAHTSRRKGTLVRNQQRRRDSDRQLACGVRAFNAFVTGQPLHEMSVREGTMPTLLTPEQAAKKPWKRQVRAAEQASLLDEDTAPRSAAG